MVRKGGEGIVGLADDLFKVVEPLESVGGISDRLSLAGWKCLADQRGICFLRDDVSTGYRRVVFLEGVRTIRVWEYVPEFDNELPPARKDRYRSMIGIYPMYKNSPIFDELASTGIESGLSGEQVAEILKELNLLLY